MAAPKVAETQEIKSNEPESKQPEIKEESIIIPKPDKGLLNKMQKDILELYNHKAKYEVLNNGSVTFFPTPNCVPSKQQIPTSKISMDNILKKENCTNALAYSNPNDDIIQQQPYRSIVSSFITSSLKSWARHYPFRFRSEHIWLLILQSVAAHVDQNAEQLRNKYVKHEGKKELLVEISASPSPNEWMNTIKNFADQIDKNTVDDTVQIFNCDFSTSTLSEKIATKVTIMDICKNYFSYKCYTRCGFPQITINGTKQDWIKLKQKTIQLLDSKVGKQFGKQWSESLLPILDRFIVAFDGNIDCAFWNSMIKRGARGGSGARSWYSGWINVFFPIIEGRWNRFCEPYSMEREYVKNGMEGTGNGPDIGDFPMGIASAPVKWNRMGTIINLKFISGFVGFKQDPKTLEICPNIGWCVAKCMTAEQIKAKDAKKNNRWGY